MVLLAASIPQASAQTGNVAMKWSNETLRLVKETLPFLSPPGVARALAIVDTCMYDAMVPYTQKVRFPSFSFVFYNSNQRFISFLNDF